MFAFPAIALVLALTTCTAHCASDTKQISVSRQQCEDVLSCVENGGMSRPCCSLEYVATQTSNFGPVILSIHSTSILSQKVEFRNISNLTIRGMDTQIVCSRGGGLIFEMVTQLKIYNLSVAGCGANGSSVVITAIHLQNCTDVVVDRVLVTRSRGVGMLFQDTFGEVIITESNFTQNGNTSAEEYGNGLYIYVTHCPKEGVRVPTTYLIDNCNFVENSGYMGYKDNATQTTRQTEFRIARKGGGVSLWLRNDSCSNNVSIINSNFTRNNATWGGGLFLGFEDSSRGNTITVKGTIFVSNYASKAGGGADVGYYSRFEQLHSENRVVFHNISFYNNQANYGGGAAVFSKHTRNQSGERFFFSECVWHKNLAYFSPAVDISPFIYDTLSNGFLPIPVFFNCRFDSNVVKQRTIKHWQSQEARYANAGSFIVTKFTVRFGGEVVFKNNMYSALQATSGAIEFLEGSNVLFFNNTGINGGAIALYGFSSLKLHSNSLLKFSRNTAVDSGGAIYHHSYDQHDFVSARTCFMQYSGRNSTNLTVIFSENTAVRSGNSIFALSFYPCYFQYFQAIFEKTKMFAVFSKIGNFHFDNLQDSLGTEGSEFHSCTDKETLRVIPGKQIKLPVGIRDELHNEISTLYRLVTSNPGTLQPDHPYTTQGNIRLFGTPNTTGTFELHSVNFREMVITIKVAFQTCPPGYFYYEGEQHRCTCAAYFPERAYPGIVHCNSSLFQAYIEHGYWAGYPSDCDVTPDGLYTALCPLGFCSHKLESAGPLFLLPDISSWKMLDYSICGQYRTGVLCGKCDRGFSVYYHSRQYKCATSDNCRLGVLYYILSEIIPLTILFTTVIVFDIRFTSGALNGFIFFSQVLDTLSIDASGAIKFPTSIDTLSIGYRVLYGLLNFDFFGIEQLSFCLWENATVLDAVAFKYVTVVFALILVVALVTLMRWCDCRQLCKIKRKISTKQSVIHGLTAFLVMCYVQCTRVSFQILTAVTLTGKGGHSGDRVTLYGGVLYLGKEHLPYAIPAVLCIATLVALPPILLLLFPLCNHILYWFGLSENETCSRIMRCFLVNQLKPLIDSFQGCFKDKLRFFAGLYFVYRIAILAAYTFTTSDLQFYFIIEVLIVFMFIVHATAQPYINRLHNIIDSLVFGNLALINAFTIHNFYHQLKSQDSHVDAEFWIQIILIYLPLVSMAVFIIGKIVHMYPKTKAFKGLSEAYVNLTLDSSDSGVDHGHLPIPYQEFELSSRTRQASPPERPDFGIDD